MPKKKLLVDDENAPEFDENDHWRTRVSDAQRTFRPHHRVVVATKVPASVVGKLDDVIERWQDEGRKAQGQPWYTRWTRSLVAAELLDQALTAELAKGGKRAKKSTTRKRAK